MFEILCYTKIENKQIATLRTPIIPKISEKVDIDISEPNSVHRIRGRIGDIEYRFDKNGILMHILMFLDTD